MLTRWKLKRYLRKRRPEMNPWALEEHADELLAIQLPRMPAWEADDILGCWGYDKEEAKKIVAILT